MSIYSICLLGTATLILSQLMGIAYISGFVLIHTRILTGWFAFIRTGLTQTMAVHGACRTHWATMQMLRRRGSVHSSLSSSFASLAETVRIVAFRWRGKSRAGAMKTASFSLPSQTYIRSWMQWWPCRCALHILADENILKKFAHRRCIRKKICRKIYYIGLCIIV